MPQLSIKQFRGIDQSVSENDMSLSYSPDACNMETENGDLAVAKGYVKHISTAIPGTGTIYRMYYWRKGADTHILVAAGSNLYAWQDGAWITIYTYTEAITATEWDFVEARMGDDDYLLIANGQSQLVKWDGGATAEAFGSGEWVYEGTVASVGYNIPKATNVTYDDKVGVYTLTMENWTYAAGGRVAFLITDVKSVATSIKANIGEHTHAIETLPTWESGNIVELTLTDVKTATQKVHKKGTATYAESGTTGTYTVVMDVTDPVWAYAANCEIAFVVPAVKSADTITTFKVVIGTGTYTMSAAPTWKVNDIAVVKLTGATACTAQAVACPSVVTYADRNGVYKLTMPDGWMHNDGQEIAFDITSTISVNVTELKLAIGDNTYCMNYVPGWVTGDKAVVKLASSSKAEYSLTEYGISTVTLNAAISADWKQRAINVGLRIKDVTRKVSAVSENRLTVTLEKPCIDEIAAGDTAKLRGEVSNMHVKYTEMHFSRLFAAGDPDHPSRLYWSQPPGDTRTIEDWSMDDDSTSAGGGHTDVGNTSSDAIVGLCSLSNQLLIFKESSIYRLLGASPDEYRVVPVNMKTERMYNSGLVKYGDTPFWIARSGMYYHDGSQGRLAGAAKRIRYLLQNASLSTMKSAECRDKLYFTCKRGNGTLDDSIIVYNMVEQTYMLRNGFNVIDICSFDGTVYIINESRYVCRFEEGSTYDGSPIEAYWKTPQTDLNTKGVDKQPRRIHLRGTGGAIILVYKVGMHEKTERYLMKSREEEVLTIAMLNMGRTLQLTIKNERGSNFRLIGGVEIEYDGGEI